MRFPEVSRATPLMPGPAAMSRDAALSGSVVNTTTLGDGGQHREWPLEMPFGL